MDRSSHSKQLTHSSGKLYLSSTYYPNISIRDSDIYIISNETTMLDMLAYEYYKDKDLWWIIYRANNLTGGKLTVPIGIQLRIPTNIYSILQDFKNINST